MELFSDFFVHPDNDVGTHILLTLASHYDIVINMGGGPRNHRLYDLAIDTWAQIDDSYESEALNSIREALTLIDNILNWYATKGVDKRLKRLLDLGKWKARGNALR